MVHARCKGLRAVIKNTASATGRQIKVSHIGLEPIRQSIGIRGPDRPAKLVLATPTGKADIAFAFGGLDWRGFYSFFRAQRKPHFPANPRSCLGGDESLGRGPESECVTLTIENLEAWRPMESSGTDAENSLTEGREQRQTWSQQWKRTKSQTY